jgi:hypothetical protein
MKGIQKPERSVKERDFLTTVVRSSKYPYFSVCCFLLNITHTNTESCTLSSILFFQDNMKASFDLNHLYNECKADPLKKKKCATENKTEAQNTHIKSE